MKKLSLPWVLLAVSVLFNLYLGGDLLIKSMNAPTDRIGVLKRNIQASSFENQRILFTLPKGLTVRDASPGFIASIDVFERNRFAIVLTSDDENVIDYSVADSSLQHYGELYSIENRGSSK
jgi:hypothetical protein